MAKATVPDIALMAGVSTATVDRVLNGRAGVSAANRQRVNSAAQALGYLPYQDKVAVPSRPAHLEFFFPLGRSEFLRDLAAAIVDFAERLPLVASCRVNGPRPFAIFHDLTDATRRLLSADVIDVVIDQNARLTGEQAVIRLLGSMATSAPFLTLQHIEPRIILRENIPAG